MRPILTRGAAAVPSRGMSRTTRTIAIHKFGGTSLGDASRIRNAARLLAAARKKRPVVAVASAMGGVTDVLLEAARDAERGRLGLARKAVESLRARHAAAARELGVRFDEAPLRELDAALAGRLPSPRADGPRDRPRLLVRRAPLGAAPRGRAREGRRSGARRRRPRHARHGRPPRRRDVRPEEERPARAAPPADRSSRAASCPS